MFTTRFDSVVSIRERCGVVMIRSSLYVPASRMAASSCSYFFNASFIFCSFHFFVVQSRTTLPEFPLFIASNPFWNSV